MRTMLKSLLAATTLLFLAPLSASALPEQCSEICEAGASCCGDPCAIGGTLTTCGRYIPSSCDATCVAPAPMEDLVMQGESRQDDASSLVCSAENQAAEQSAAEG
ncbi:hypothetical protein F0U59_24445 [Archangium gephyra]|nr:hypothetical protein F0U59_24445 [Archangium gephyra]